MDSSEPRRLDLYTGRYETHRPEHGLAVRTTVGRPRFQLAYSLAAHLREITPYGLLGLDWTEFQQRFRARLDGYGVDLIRERLEAIAREHRTDRLVLLCFEDVHAGERCHRRLFADWWIERTGEAVPEVEPAQIALDVRS